MSKQALLEMHGIALEPGLYKVNKKDDCYDIYTVKNDTLGCPLVGMHRSRSGIDTCAPACDHIYAAISAAERQGEVWLTVEDTK